MLHSAAKWLPKYMGLWKFRSQISALFWTFSSLDFRIQSQKVFASMFCVWCFTSTCFASTTVLNNHLTKLSFPLTCSVSNCGSLQELRGGCSQCAAAGGRGSRQISKRFKTRTKARKWFSIKAYRMLDKGNVSLKQKCDNVLHSTAVGLNKRCPPPRNLNNTPSAVWHSVKFSCGWSTGSAGRWFGDATMLVAPSRPSETSQFLVGGGGDSQLECDLYFRWNV